LPKELIYRPKQGFGIKIGKFGNFVLEDLEKAILYHKQNAKVLGIIDSGLEGVVEVKNAKVILDKFPRFAYALITNHQVMQKYLK
jgi:hypothetical protein